MYVNGFLIGFFIGLGNMWHNHNGTIALLIQDGEKLAALINPQGVEARSRLS